MKRMIAKQMLDPAWVDRTPAYVYEVTKLTNAINPAVGKRLTALEMDGFCASDEWEVVIS